MDYKFLLPFILSLGLLFTGSRSYAQDAWTLEQCVERGLEKNLDIQRSELNRDISEINLRQAKFSRLPDLNAGATHGYNWGQTIDPFTNEFASDRVRNNNFFMQSNVVLFSGFQVNNRIKQSSLDLDATELDLLRAKNDISLLIAQGYLNILFAKEQVNAVQEQVNISQRQEVRMGRLVDAGQEALSGLYDVRSQLASDQFTLTQAENNLEIVKLNLANLLLLDPEQVASFDAKAPSDEVLEADRPLFTVSEIYAQALSTQPQVQAAELRSQVSEVGLSIAQGGRSPQISVRGSVGSGYSGNNLIPLGDPIFDFQTIGVVEGTNQEVVAPDVSYSGFETKSFNDQLDDNFNQSLSLSLTVPIFNGLQTSSDISRSKIDYQLNKLNEQDTRNILLQNVQQAHADATAAQKSKESAQLALEAMKLNFSNAEKRFEQEMISTVDYNDVKSRLAQAEIEAIRAKYDYVFRMTIIDFYLGKRLNIN